MKITHRLAGVLAAAATRSHAISAGDRIKIRTHSGTLVASGTFHRDW